ncbi:MAG: hypothetical protein WCQ50_20020, partial [Spirochaetota bacterium]
LEKPQTKAELDMVRTDPGWIDRQGIPAGGRSLMASMGIYLFDRVAYKRGLELYHIAAKLRSGCFNYLSQESVLSDAGCISQVPLQRITLMTSGRSSLASCGIWGSIEFTHTKKVLDRLSGELSYDPEIRLLRASPRLALADLRAARRNLDLTGQKVLD